MEAARGGVVAVQPPRKEWRAVAEHPFRSNGTEEVERGKMGQSDERTIYEDGAGPPDVDFCSIPMDAAGVNVDVMHQRIQEITRQRMELLEMEIGMKAQAIARSAIAEAQNRCDERVKEHADAAAKLKEQLQEKELHARELEMKLEDKEGELRALQLDTEAAWAKEDLLREQNKELATFRRERDNSEAERAHHLKQIHDLKEHLQEKESQVLELQEQHRVAQETLIYKEEQLREAQAWIARVQEMDALQSTTNQSLQAELRERTEQFNQYWGLLLRQYAEMERHFMQTIQQLQLELTEARERSGLRNDDPQIANSNLKHSSSYAQSNGSQFSGNENSITTVNSLSSSNGGLKSEPCVTQTSNVPAKHEHAAGVPIVPSSIIGMGAYVQPSQVNTLQPFVMHTQGALHPVSSANPHLAQSHIGNFQSVTGNLTVQSTPSHQVVLENSEMSNHKPNQSSGAEQAVSESGVAYSFEQSDNKQGYHSENGNLANNIKQAPNAKDKGSNEHAHIANNKLLDSTGQNYLPAEESAETLSENSQYQPSALALKLPEQNISTKFQDEIPSSGSHEPRGDILESEQLQPAGNSAASTPTTYSASASDASEGNMTTTSMPEIPASTMRVANSLAPAKASSPALLDEKSLLACIVRAIPLGSNGRIRISTTLPNRLGKMLAPFHWHDYRKLYGKLDDFVSRHPELFVIEDDFIHLREGAQEIVSANAAAARFAAAASASASYSSNSIAVTPIAQGHRQKWYQSADVKYSGGQSSGHSLISASGELGNKHPQHLVMQNQQLNSAGFDVLDGLTDMKIVSKPRGPQEMDLPSDVRSGQSSGYIMAENGTTVDQVRLPPSQIKVLGRGKNGPIGRQHGRTAGSVIISRR